MPSPRIRWPWFLGSLHCAASAYGDGSRFNMPQGATWASHQIYDLHMLIFWISAAIFVLVAGTIAWILVRFRRARGAVPGGVHEHAWVEIAWTVIPFLVLAVMAFPATHVLTQLVDTRNADLTIQVTGSQWKWRYDYVGEGVGFFSNLATPMEQRQNLATKSATYLSEVDRPLVVPVGEKIRLLITASDVIHSWWVPELGIKRDAIPGFINDIWVRIDTPGFYRGQCAELCGIGHAFMPIVVEARHAADFRVWLASAKEHAAHERAEEGRTLPLGELMEHGKEVFTANCAPCHQPNGEGIPGTFPPLKGGKITTGPLPEHLATVINGRPGTAMASFAQLSDSDLAAVITYERNAWGNNLGTAVQIADIKAARAALGK